MQYKRVLTWWVSSSASLEGTLNCSNCSNYLFHLVHLWGCLNSNSVGRWSWNMAIVSLLWHHVVLLFDSNTDRVPGQTNYSLAGWYIYNNTNNITRNIQSTYNHQTSSEILSLRKSDLSTCLYLSHNFLSFIQGRFHRLWYSCEMEMIASDYPEGVSTKYERGAANRSWTWWFNLVWIKSGDVLDFIQTSNPSGISWSSLTQCQQSQSHFCLCLNKLSASWNPERYDHSGINCISTMGRLDHIHLPISS